ncbi:MAG: DUF1385 domain-containing protein [Candidatus Margulisbacteria bacterium]|nr:DUF1385 domain-containing protein [Candidatus Margulisiibacteriota bacterium]
MADKNKVDPIGGQAVIEGVMMRGKELVVVAIRKPNQEILIEKHPFLSWTKKYPILSIFFIRGFITLVEMLIIGSKILMRSADVALPEEEKKAMKSWEMPLAWVTSMVMAVGLFIVIQAYAFTLLKNSVANTILLNFYEGLVRLSIFLCFLTLVSLMKDMRRVFEYHGAEHKVVNMYEKKEPLTIENAKKYSTRHPRCGTSFLLVVMVVSIIIFSFLGRPDFLHRILYKLMLLPVVSGVSYEFIRLTDKLKGTFLVFLTWPGVVLQLLTTREPDEAQLEVALTSLKAVLEG